MTLTLLLKFVTVHFWHLLIRARLFLLEFRCARRAVRIQGWRRVHEFVAVRVKLLEQSNGSFRWRAESRAIRLVIDVAQRSLAAIEGERESLSAQVALVRAGYSAWVAYADAAKLEVATVWDTPPGGALRRLLALVYSAKTMTRVFDQVIADMQTDWVEGRAIHSHWWYFAWLRVRCLFEVLQAILADLDQKFGPWQLLWSIGELLKWLWHHR